MRVGHAVAGLDGVLVHIGDEDLVRDAGVAEQLGAGGGLGGKNEAGHRSSLVDVAAEAAWVLWKCLCKVQHSTDHRRLAAARKSLL